jgi:hypothetical protein
MSALIRFFLSKDGHYLAAQLRWNLHFLILVPTTKIRGAKASKKWLEHQEDSNLYSIHISNIVLPYTILDYLKLPLSLLDYFKTSHIFLLEFLFPSKHFTPVFFLLFLISVYYLVLNYFYLYKHSSTPQVIE